MGTENGDPLTPEAPKALVEQQLKQGSVADPASWRTKMLKLTLAFNATWSADGFVYLNPDAIGSVVRCTPAEGMGEHTSVNLLVRGADNGPCFYPVEETPAEILAMLESLKTKRPPDRAAS